MPRPRPKSRVVRSRPSSGSSKAPRRETVDKMMSLVGAEVRKIASQHLADERADHVLQTTALVHEAYLRLVQQRNIRESDRSHFLAAATTAIRRVLVDYARQRDSLKRGGQRIRVELDKVEEMLVRDVTDFLATDEALTQLAALDPRAAKVVELRYIGGLTVAETAKVLKVSVRAVYEDWAMARAWLRKELSRDKG